MADILVGLPLGIICYLFVVGVNVIPIAIARVSIIKAFFAVVTKYIASGLYS